MGTNLTEISSITRLSVADDGTEGNNSSSTPAISADGRFVAFSSNADNLVPGDTNTNNSSDIFVRDLLTGTITLVSVAEDGTQGGTSSFSSTPSISADGRFVAFYSFANNLVPGDTNNNSDIFVRDLQTGTTTRVSVADDGTQGNNFSSSPSISADGRFVAFSSNANNLVPGDTNNNSDIFVRDLQTGTTTLVSVADDSIQGGTSSFSSNPSISADGRFVAFTSSANNLVAGDTNNNSDIFVRDLQTGTTTRVSVAEDGTQGNRSSSSPSISADGRFVAFESSAYNLVPRDTNNSSDIFVRDLLTGSLTRVSVAEDGTQGNNFSSGPSISADGRFVAFSSNASNLVAGDTNNSSDIFVRDLQTGTTTLVSVADDNIQGGIFTSSSTPSISANGNFVAFSSTAFNLVAGDTNNSSDIFLATLTGVDSTTSII
ncbi:PD40 domain-containing protein [Brasilonema sp. UFV-L1]|uniref:TolB family protein n=1 Tax=Brasilonema sp. UFV-L1 TaxID=2234130 RepID=UPI00145C5D22|nr:PD40 domain-containing protein [Brasilonema sp. UFV-L1]NMG06351.1 hypothetical protein [Brasilonema sp. UFV-L1]